MDDHIPKPIDFNVLLSRLLAWVEPRHLAEESSRSSEVMNLVPTLPLAVMKQLETMLAELEELLSNNLFKAKRVAEQVDCLLKGTVFSADFQAVSDLTRKMEFKDALVSLRNFMGIVVSLNLSES